MKNVFLKKQKKMSIFSLLVFVTIILGACKQYKADVKEFLEYWTSQAFVTEVEIKNETQTDLNGIKSVSSLADVEITLKLENPKNFTLLMPSADETREILSFNKLGEGITPKVDSDYTMEQIGNTALKLVLKKEFLQKMEWGIIDLGPTITLYATDGRKFSNPFTFNIKANTPPPKPTVAVAKTTGTPSYYVLCITVPETDMRKAVAGGLLHKDLAHVEINETPYAFSVNEAEKKFVKPESDSFITLSDVAKLTAPDADKVPTGGWVLYYKTDVEVKEGAAKKAYTVRLADEQGLVSAPLNASTKPNRPAPVQISRVKGICTADVNSDNTGAAPHIIGVGEAEKPATLRLTCATADSTIYYTLTEIVAGSLASPLTASGAGSGVDISLPIQPGKTEAEYTLTVRAEAAGFETGAERTLYYKIIAQNTDTALSELKLKEGSDEYSAALIAGSDSAYICKIPFAERVRNLTLTATTANSRSTITAVTVDGASPAGFAAANTVTLTNAVTLPNSLPAAQVTVKITVTAEDPTVTKEYTLTVTYPPVLTSLGFTSGSTPVSFRNEGDTVNVTFNPHTREYYIFAAQLSPSVMGFTAVPESDATYTVKVNGNEYTGTTVLLPSVGGETLVTFTVEKAGLQNEYKVHIKRKSYTVTLKAKSSDDESAAGGGTIKVTNTTGAGIGSVNNNTSAEVTVKAEIGATITATATPNPGYTFMKWSGASISYPNDASLSYAVESQVEIKAEFKSPNIYVRGTNGDWYSNTANVPGGAAEGNDTSGTGSKKKPYATVSNALSQCTEAGTAYTIFVDGTIEENTTLDIGSSQKVTIESLRKAAMPAVIHDKRLNPTAKQCLVTTAGTLTLDSVILKANITATLGSNSSQYVYGIQQTSGEVTVKGNTTKIRNFAHAVEIKSGTFTMENGSICNNYVNGKNAGVTIEGGKFVLKGGSIENNEAKTGAGVYVKGISADNKAQFTMEDGKISNNKAKDLGGGIYVDEHGKADISGGTIKNNSAAELTYGPVPYEDVGGGGICILGGTVNFTGGTIEGNIINAVMKNCGAGVFIAAKGTFNMSGGTIKDCTTQTVTSSQSSRGIGVYVAGLASAIKGTFNMTGGTIENCKPCSGHRADGGGVYVGGKAVFTMEKDARITPSTGSDANVKGNNDVYLANGAKITIAKKLEYQLVARITPKSYPTVSESNILVLRNPADNITNVAKNYFKFTVTSDSNKAYCVNETGLIRQQVDTTPYDTNRQNWAKLKAAINNANNNDVIYVRDVCYANSANDTITVDNKTITLIGVTSEHVSLNASDQQCRIFTIKNGGNLTIKNMELKGHAKDGKGGGGILLANDGARTSLTLENVSITSCRTSGNGTIHGAGIAIYNGTVTMNGKTQISDCKSLVYGCWGGGVYIGAGGILTIDGYDTPNNFDKTYIRSCEAAQGGGVYIASGGKLELKQGQLSLNRATGTDKKGYAVYNANPMSDPNSFNWTGGTIENHGSDGTVIEGPYNNPNNLVAD